MARSVPRHIDSLPHWARVAFAARCARNVLPLFDRSWPDALPKRREPLHAAVELAERSAREGRPAPGLERAMIDCIKTAGAALIPTHEGILPSKEPVPDGEHSCVIASQVAKAAEWAAKAAQAPPSGSANAALEASTWARDVAHAAEEVDILARLHADFAGLLRVAARGRWTDETPVPPSLFDLLAEDPPETPWWAIWR